LFIDRSVILAQHEDIDVSLDEWNGGYGSIIASSDLAADRTSAVYTLGKRDLFAEWTTLTTSQSLIDDIINSVNNFVYQGVGSLETGLLSTPPEKLGFKAVKDASTGVDGAGEVEFPEAKQEIEEGLHKLETLLNSTVDKNFDKFEIYVLRNILSVPADLVNWVRLSHYNVRPVLRIVVVLD
jgi:hypothetical protein